MPKMEGMVLSAEQIGALDFCHMVTNNVSRYYFCRNKDCRFFTLADNWANSCKDRCRNVSKHTHTHTHSTS